MFRRGRKTNHAADRAARTTHYGNPKEVTVAPQKIDPNLTPYGAKKFRTPTHKDEFNGEQGSAMKAVILDIDGTLQTWGQGADAKVLEYCKKHYDQGHVLIVLTARTHDYDYERSFNWLMKNLPYPFIGPFHRACDDPRYASEFKREVAQGFEDMNLYQIVGAADDNTFVNDMWRHWADEHFADPADFDLLECGYGDYSSWRTQLPAKGTPATIQSYGTTAWTQATPSKGKIWVAGAFDKDTKEWVKGHYAEDEVFDTLLSDEDRVALEDEVMAATDHLTLKDVEQLSDEALLALGETTERGQRINNRLDLEDEVFAAYPDLSLVEIQETDVATLQDLFDNRPGASGTPIGGCGMTIETHSMLGSMRDCSWWWEPSLSSRPVRHFCGLTPGHDGPHVCSCGEEQE